MVPALREDSTETHFPANFLFLCRNRKCAVMTAKHLSNCFQCAKLEWAFQFEKQDLKKEIRRKMWHKIRKENIYVKKTARNTVNSWLKIGWQAAWWHGWGKQTRDSRFYFFTQGQLKATADLVPLGFRRDRIFVWHVPSAC